MESILQKNTKKSVSKLKIKPIWLYLMQISKEMLQKVRFCAATTSTRSDGIPNSEVKPAVNPHSNAVSQHSLPDPVPGSNLPAQTPSQPSHNSRNLPIPPEPP